jgi:hypothetical protein
MHPPVHPITPPVELQLKIARVSEGPAGQEVRTHKPVRALQRSLGLRIPGIQDDPAHLELAAERGEQVGRAPTAGDRAFPIHTSMLHADHAFLLARSLDQARVPDQPDNTGSAPKWSSFQPAQVDQYSGRV